MLTLDKVFDAQNVLKDIITTTSLQKANRITDNCTLYLKPECLQKTGSFKLRGSGYKIAGLSEEEKKRGVVACSAGNHSQGVALAATKLGIPSYICMPDGAPISKVEATKSFGAQVTLVNGVYDDAYRLAVLKQNIVYTTAKTHFAAKRNNSIADIFDDFRQVIAADMGFAEIGDFFGRARLHENV